jgi:hypothetical protein
MVVDRGQQVAALRGREKVFGDAHNGLFLAAPRRTGKSTFLQADLMPALEAAGAVPTTSEAILFEWCGTASHPQFQAVRKLVL